MASDRYIAGDIGGTKTALALYSAENGPTRPLEQAIFPSGQYDSLEAILRSFLAGKPVNIIGASFGVAGPVIDGQVRVTNLPWFLDARSISAAIGNAPVTLLNDLLSIAYAVPFIEPQDLDTIHDGVPTRGGALGILAPGTGLGEGFLVWNGNRYQAYPSEGAHATFGPSNPLEVKLVEYLLPRYDHISYERVCSGIGIPNLYTFLRDSQGLEEPAWLSKQLAKAVDPTPMIVKAGLENQAAIAVEALELFVSILGSEAGNLALKVMATGGLYLAGGIPPRIATLLRKETFMHALTNKGRFARMLSKIPVHIILQPQVALFGAACHALQGDQTLASS